MGQGNHFNLLSGQQEEQRGGAPPADVHPEAKLSEDLYTSYKAARETWATQAVNDAAFRNNAQFTEQQEAVLEAKGHAPLPTNIIHAAVEQAKATLCANSPKFHATGRETTDIRMGAVFADLMSYIWERSQGNNELKQVVDDYYVKGLGAMAVYEDPYADFGKGEICIKSLDPLHLYIDPNSQDILCRDAAHMLIVKTMTHEQLQQSYPEILPKLEFAVPIEGNDDLPAPTTTGDAIQADRASGFDRMHKRYRVIDRYSRVKVPRIHLIDGRGIVEKIFNDTQEYEAFLQSPAFVEINAQNDMTFFLSEEEIQMEGELYQATNGTYHYAQNPQTGEQVRMPGAAEGAMQDLQSGVQPIPGSTIVIEQITMAEVLQMGALQKDSIFMDRVKRVFTVGGILPFDPVVMEVSHFPITVFMNRHNRTPYPMSDVRFIRPIQAFINKLMSLIMAHTSSSTGNKLLIPHGSMDRAELLKEWEKAGPSVIEYDPELGTPVVSGPTPLTGDVFTVLEGAKKTAFDILGIYPLGQGDATNAPDTFKGTVAIDEYGQRRLKSKKDDIEAALNHMGRVVTELIQKVYTYHKVVRLLRPNNEIRELVINQIVDDPTQNTVQKINDITVGQYDLVFVAGSTLPVNRWARLEYYLGLYDRGIIDNIEVLKQTEVVDMAGVLERMDLVRKLQQQLAMMEEKVKELQGDLQTATRESVQDRKRVEVEKFKAQLAEMASEAKKATTLYGERLTDEISMSRREMAMEKKSARSKRPSS